MAWVLTRGMTNLRNQINKVGPERDKASDGTIGNAAHATGTSGHNPDLTGNAEYKDGDSKDEVRAIDTDNSGPWLPGVTAEKIVQHLVEKGRSGNLETQIRYLIYNRRIWAASTGWVTQVYNGASPHTEHIHASGAYNQAADENTTYDYGLESLVIEDMAITPDEFLKIRLNSALGIYDMFWSMARGVDIHDINYAAVGQPTRDNMRAVLGGPVDQAVLMAAIASDNVDTEALAAALLPGLSSAVGTQVTAAIQPLIDDGVLTAAEVTSAVQSGVRNVLGSLDNQA